MRILLAEDDSVLVDGLSRSLRQSGYAVDCVKSGSDADVVLSTQEFDLLILDLGLPRLPGLEVLRRLRARDSHLPVLILTASDSVEQRVKGLVEAAKRKGVETIAERVEDANTMAVLWQLGVEFIQGYFVNAPEDVTMSSER